MSDLKPCPWCGNKDDVRIGSYEDCPAVMCGNCGARTFEPDYGSEGYVFHWNKRLGAPMGGCRHCGCQNLTLWSESAHHWQAQCYVCEASGPVASSMLGAAVAWANGVAPA